MTARRATLAATAGTTALLGVMMVIIRWDDASKVAVIVSALAAVAAVGIAIWAALPGAPADGNWRVSRTGSATAGPRGRANSGISGPASSLAASIRINRTGQTHATGEGNANSGIQGLGTSQLSRPPAPEEHQGKQAGN